MHKAASAAFAVVSSAHGDSDGAIHAMEPWERVNWTEKGPKNDLEAWRRVTPDAALGSCWKSIVDLQFAPNEKAGTESW